MPDLENAILAAIGRKGYQPMKPKALARKLGVPAAQYADFRRALRNLRQQGRIEMGKNHSVRQPAPHGTITGIFRRLGGENRGYVRPHAIDGKTGPEVYVPEGKSLDASTGDEVLVRLLRKPNRPAASTTGEILQVLERATRQFVGTYFERKGRGLVRVDGNVFRHSIYVGDPGAKGAKPNDKVVFEMLRFPTEEDWRGEGVITEILGAHGQPGVDTLSIIRAFELPDEFPEEVKEEARAAAAAFQDAPLADREDFTHDLVITIDPPDAHDFDDAVSLTRDSKSKHWFLTVHIADVSHFVPPGSALDKEARKRGTSVYLPQKVLPMFPELLSNGLASLQQDKPRFVKTVIMDFTPAGQRTHVRFANGLIRVRQRFSYEQVYAILKEEPGARDNLDPQLLAMLQRMEEFALILRQRRRKHGALELHMPEVELEYDDQGRVSGAHYRRQDISHQIIEEFMLAANEAVADHLTDLGVLFLRRVHPAPDEAKLQAFADFVETLGYKLKQVTDRFALQRILEQSADRPEVHAVHYALLRSLKQAVYSPSEEEHYALASTNYCHFTSPIRRYPDLTVHRLLQQWLTHGKAGSDMTELAALGEHCSKTERRAELAERELIKLKLLMYMEERLGLELDALITGVADYGFFAQAEQFPIEGLVHVSTLTDDYYRYDELTHSLIGKRTYRRYRLGDKVKVEVVRVDVQRKQLDFRVVKGKKEK
ncbi:MAG: ribonuclease R [Gemmataceae bacterium]